MELKAPAKVNLGLNVVAKRPDGYHELDGVMARLELHDTLSLTPRSNGITLTVAGADLAADASNLAYRAAQAYLTATGESRGVHLHLTKRIPLAAGLGGGSSDAAAVLRGLSRLYPAEVDLLSLAAKLGADVPFFVVDVPAARARGIGERLTPLKLPTLHLVLVNPGIAVSAKEAYAALRTLAPPLDVAALLASLPAEPSYQNSLQAGVVAAYPTIAEALSALRAEGLRGVLMSGSGATCFGLAQDEAHAQAIAKRLSARYPRWWVCVTYSG
jgi:4-diphosphocytidyl-2-C-methyl-D-erythritol kinase